MIEDVKNSLCESDAALFEIRLEASYSENSSDNGFEDQDYSDGVDEYLDS